VPFVQIRVSYPGADATTLQNSVTQVIEQNMTGLDGLMIIAIPPAIITIIASTQAKIGRLIKNLDMDDYSCED
jgi:hypothetical protein